MHDNLLADILNSSKRYSLDVSTKSKSGKRKIGLKRDNNIMNAPVAAFDADISYIISVVKVCIAVIIC